MTSFHRLLFFIVVSSIFAIGLIMIFNTTSAEILDHSLDKSTRQALFRQMLYALVGIGLSIGILKIGYQRLITYSPYILGFFTILLVLVLIPGVGREVNGSKRWLSLAGLSLQPSEFVKYLIPAFFIFYLERIHEATLTLKNFLKLIGSCSLPMGLILIEPNNGTAAVIGMTLVLLCFITGISFKYWALPLIICIAIGGTAASQLPYVKARLKVYLNPELDLKGKGHQPYQAKIAAGSGKIFGKGPGNSLQKMSYLPEAQNDYIAAIYAEEFGFVGMIILIVLYMSLACLGFSIAYNATELSGFYYATAITFLMCFQAFLNLGVVSGLLPSTGLNLPFFSQGGSSLMANIISLGVLLSIAQYRDEPLQHTF